MGRASLQKQCKNVITDSNRKPHTAGKDVNEEVARCGTVGEIFHSSLGQAEHMVFRRLNVVSICHTKEEGAQVSTQSTSNIAHGGSRDHTA